MKTTALFTAAFIFSTASFAQQVGSSVQQAATASLSGTKPAKTALNGSSSSAVSANTSVINAKEAKKSQVTEKAVAKTEAAKKELKDKGTAAVKAGSNAVNENKSVSASTATSAEVKGTSSGNKISQDASLTTSAQVSGNEVTNNVKQNGEAIKTGVHTTATKTVKSTSAIAGSVRPKPAPIRIDSHIRTGAGIKIK